MDDKKYRITIVDRDDDGIFVKDRQDRYFDNPHEAIEIFNSLASSVYLTTKEVSLYQKENNGEWRLCSSAYGRAGR